MHIRLVVAKANLVAAKADFAAIKVSLTATKVVLAMIKVGRIVSQTVSVATKVVVNVAT